MPDLEFKIIRRTAYYDVSMMSGATTIYFGILDTTECLELAHILREAADKLDPNGDADA